jgi:hypothetical protein
MAANDIRVWNSPTGGHTRVRHYRVDAGQTFLRGEPVGVRDDGQLNECADPAAFGGIIGIALADAVVDTTIDWRTSIAMVENATIPVALANMDTEFITSNFTNAGSAFGDAAPALADLGEEVSVDVISGVWGISQAGAAATQIARIMDVLDANFESVQDSGGTGVYVVFVIVGHQLATDDAGAADARVAT